MRLWYSGIESGFKKDGVKMRALVAIVAGFRFMVRLWLMALCGLHICLILHQCYTLERRWEKLKIWVRGCYSKGFVHNLITCVSWGFFFSLYASYTLVVLPLFFSHLLCVSTRLFFKVLRGGVNQLLPPQLGQYKNAHSFTTNADRAYELTSWLC